MVAPVHVLSPRERLASAASKLSELGVSALPVVDSSQRLTGVLERTDLLRVGRLRARPEPGEPRFWWPDVSVAECMQTTVPVAPPERTLRQCAQRMLERGLHRVYVLSDHELLGVLSTRELLRAVQRAELAAPIAALAAQPASTLTAEQPLSAACALLAASPEQALLVLSGTAPLGVFSRAELRACLEIDPEQSVAPYADESLIVLDAAESASRAAERALAAKVRYIVTRDAAGQHRIVSGLCFASCICGGVRLPPPAAERLPVMAVPTALPGSSEVHAEQAARTAPLASQLGRPVVPAAIPPAATPPTAIPPTAIPPAAIAAAATRATATRATAAGATASLDTAAGVAATGAGAPASERRSERTPSAQPGARQPPPAGERR